MNGLSAVPAVVALLVMLPGTHALQQGARGLCMGVEADCGETANPDCSNSPAPGTHRSHRPALVIQANRRNGRRLALSPGIALRDARPRR